MCIFGTYIGFSSHKIVWKPCLLWAVFLFAHGNTSSTIIACMFHQVDVQRETSIDQIPSGESLVFNPTSERSYTRCLHHGLESDLTESDHKNDQPKRIPATLRWEFRFCRVMAGIKLYPVMSLLRKTGSQRQFLGSLQSGYGIGSENVWCHRHRVPKLLFHWLLDEFCMWCGEV